MWQELNSERPLTLAHVSEGRGVVMSGVGGFSGGGWQESPKWVLAEAGCPCGLTDYTLICGWQRPEG